MGDRVSSRSQSEIPAGRLSPVYFICRTKRRWPGFSRAPPRPCARDGNVTLERAGGSNKTGEEKMVMIGAAAENAQRVSGEQRKGNSSVMSCGSNLDAVMTHKTNAQPPRRRRQDSICHKIAGAFLRSSGKPASDQAESSHARRRPDALELAGADEPD